MWRTIYHEFRRWAKVSWEAAAASKRTEITVETDQVWIIRKAQAARGWCAECGREVDMVGVAEAVELGRTFQPLTNRSSSAPLASAQPMLPGCGDSRGWHWSQAENGEPLVCLDSVLKSTK
jgi:hypothetical protein